MTLLDDDPFVLAQHRRTRRMRVIKVVVGLVSLCAARTVAFYLSTTYSKWENALFDPELRERALAPAEVDAVKSALAEARTAAAKAQQGWRAAIDAAIAEGSTSCPPFGDGWHPMPAPDAVEATRGPSWLTTSRAGVAATKPALLSRLEVQIKQLTTGLGKRYTNRTAASFVEEAKALSTPKFWTWDVLFVVDNRDPAEFVQSPRFNLRGEFRAGKVDGRAYLYDYRAAKVICSVKVHAESSNHLATLHVGAREAAEKDLDAQTWQAISDALQYRVWP